VVLDEAWPLERENYEGEVTRSWEAKYLVELNGVMSHFYHLG
jgi:hypothetical protein